MKKLKLFPKNFIYTFGIMSIIVLFIHGLMYVMLPSFYLDEKQKEVQSKVNDLMMEIKDTDAITSKKISKDYSQHHNVNIILKIDEVVYRYQGFTPLEIYYDLDAFGDVEYSDTKLNQDERVNNDSDNFRLIMEKQTFINSNGQAIELHMMLSMQPINETKQIVLKLLPYSLMISLFISFIAAFTYSKLITRPIKNILQATKNMEALKEDSYCEVKSEDEIGMIAENINALYETLWQTIESLEQKINDISMVEQEKVEFLRAASHELKTPLTSLHILLENMKHNIGKYSNRDYYLAEAEDMVMESTQIVQNILNTSKLQTVNKDEEKEYVDVKKVLLEVLEGYEILAKAKEINLNLHLEETCYLYIDKDGLKKVLSNLIANTISYTDEMKQINIEIKGERLSIENECEPLSDKVLLDVFKPFYRPDFSRSKQDGGTGLGLYIVDSILTNSKINYTFRPSKIGMKFIIICD